MKYIHTLKITFISFAVFILMWQLIVLISDINSNLLPGPLLVWNAFLEMISDGTLLEDIISSLCRFLIGYLSAVVMGLVLGIVLGWFKGVYSYINPIIQLLRPISPIAWMPFIVLLVGIGDIPAIVIIFIAAFFPVLLSSISAVGNIDKTYLRVAANFGIKQPHILTKIVFPAAFPQIANGLHLALGTAWVFLVAGEMVGAQSGLGFLIIDARNNIRADKLLVAILMIGIIGFLLDSLIKRWEHFMYAKWGYE